MNCHSEYQPFQLNDYQHQYNTVAQQQQQQQQHYQQQNFVNYQQTFDQRPAPSFRIEDILLQGGKPGGHSPLPYGGLYPGQQYPAYPSAPLQHGCIEERDYQDQMAPGVDGLPMYFRLKQNHGRTMSGRKCRKPRTVFSELQLMVLEREFNDHKYLSTPQRTKLADRLGLNQTQVKTWYQNRRMKWKKESSDCSSEAKKSKQDDANVTTDYDKTFPINQTSASQEPLNRAISHM